MIRTGTTHFVSHAAAQRYYVAQAYCDRTKAKAVVNDKLKAGEIAIGEPCISLKQKLGIDTVEGRYFIEE